MKRLKNQLWGIRLRSVRVWLLFSLLSCLLAATVGAAADVQVTAELNPTVFAVDQAVQFIITVTGAGSAQPEMPVADGFRFGYPSQSKQSSIQIINGKMSSTDLISFIFTVQAEKTGTQIIGPVSVTVDEKVYTTQPVTCDVLPVGKKNTASSDENIGFMRIMPETERIYSGQLVPFILRAYFRAGMQISLKSAPRFTGDNFLLHFLDEEPKQRREKFNGVPYTSLIWRGTLSAVKEGTVPLVVEMDTEVMVQAARQRSGSLFMNDPFFGNLFGQYSRRDITITSLEKSITVIDLPAENRPDNFSGAVGTFSLSVAASPLAGKIGDPVTLKMKVAGSGNFDMVRAPEMIESDGWKVYPATDSFTEQDGRGEKLFERAVIPIKEGLNAVPQLKFSYFDPTAEDYVTLISDPISLSLAGAVTTEPPASSPVQTTAATDGKIAKKDATSDGTARKKHFAPLRTELGTLVPAVLPLYQKIWFQGVMVAALLFLLASLLLYLRRKKLENDPKILLHKQVERRLTQYYKKMENVITAGDQEKFCHYCRAAIRERTGEVWGLAPEGITLADLEQRLPDDAPVRVIFFRLEQSGYAGEHLAQADLKEVLRTTRNELDKLV